ncbi:MAG: CBS domain-containing protein [Candidatus Hadarchaeaceae archaeon]
MKVKDVMTKEVKWVEVPGSRSDALDLLRKLGVSAVPVVKRGTEELVGMVTLRKLFEHPDEDQLAMLVDRDIPIVSPDDNLEEAALKFLKSGVRRMPVLKDGKIVGVITVRDIVYRAIAELDIDRPASDLMRKHVFVVWEGTPLKAAVEIMDLAAFRGLPVINENGAMVGIIDDYDIIRVSDVEVGSKVSQMSGRSEGDSWTWDSEDRIYITKSMLKIPDKSVKDVMTRELVTITRKTPISRVAQLMKQSRVEQTPVVSSEGKLVGIVRDIDLLRALTE